MMLESFSTRSICVAPRRLVALVVAVVLAVTLVAAPGCGAAGGRPASGNPPLGFRVLGTRIPAEAESIPIPGGWQERPPKTNRVLPKLTPAETTKGYVVFTKHYLDPVYPGTRPLREEITDRLIVSSIAGEYEPATLSIHGLKDLRGVQVVVDGLTGPGGSTIDACNVDVRTVRCMPRFAGRGSYVVRPTLLEKRPRIDIAKDTTQRFWATVWVPADSPAGLYRGSIRIKGEGVPTSSLKLQLEVLPITLLTPPTCHGMYYKPVDLNSAPQYQALPVEVLRRDIVNMTEHGMSALFVSIPPVCDAFVKEGKISFNLEPIRPFVEICQEAGLRTLIWNTTISEFTESTIGDFPTMLAAFMAGYTDEGWPALICSVGDESDANGTLPQVLPMLVQVKNAVPEMLTYTTIVFPENSELYEPNLDMRAFSSYVDDTVVKKTRQAGTQLWQYSGTSAYGLDPKGDRMYHGIWTAKLQMAGAMDWTYWSAVIDRAQPFNDLVGHRNNMTCWVFPGADGPLPSIGWEAMREGIEDEKYIFTLTARIQQAETSGDENLEGLAEDARRYLAGIYAKVDASPRTSNKVFPISRAAGKLKAEFFDQFRGEIARYLKTLQDGLAR